jgi:hypothetical protein
VEKDVLDAITNLGNKFDDFKTEFTKRMYIGNGKPAVMSELERHSVAIEDANICLAKTNNKLLLLEEKITPIIKAENNANELKKHWKPILAVFVVGIIILLLIIAGIVYTASKLPNFDKVIGEIMTRQIK